MSDNSTLPRQTGIAVVSSNQSLCFAISHSPLLTFGTSYKVRYDLVVTLESALMKFSTEVDGKSMGTVDAKFGKIQ
jgi:hypothetical protein